MAPLAIYAGSQGMGTPSRHRHDSITKQAWNGLKHRHHATIATAFSRSRAGYDCADSFDGGWAEVGHFDEASQTLVVVPLAEAYEDAAIGFFAVGRSGCGGIDSATVAGIADCGRTTRSTTYGSTWQHLSPSWSRAGVPAG